MMLAVTQLPPRIIATVVLLWFTAILLWSRSYGFLGLWGFSGSGTQLHGHNQNRLWQEQLVPKESAPRITITDNPKLIDIQNSTLGFQKIYVLSMPNRRDKRDSLTLSAYLSGLEIEFIDGVNATDMSMKEYPNKWNYAESPGTIACWRGHMDIYEKMVRERIQTAMIMEDDVDWDVMIKAQMTELARGTRYLQRASETDRSPYGDGWDILSTGHCGLYNKPTNDQDYWVIENDPTAITQRGGGRTPNTTPPALSGNSTRLVLSPSRFTCLASYAISLQGAARIIYDQEILSNAAPIDVALSAICKKTVYGYNSCLAAYPMITGTHQPAGDPAKYSDRKDIKGASPHKLSVSRGLVFPIRLNLGALLRGETIIKAQYPDTAMVKEIDIQTLQMPRGRPVFVRASEYIMHEEKSETDAAEEIKEN